ncbi:MAG: biotin synthase BioB [Pseudomonadota bacterium]
MNNMTPVSSDIRNDYTTDDVRSLFDLPFFELIDRARKIHKKYHPDNEVQLASLLSIKTGYCPENCSYCPQSAHYAKKTGVEKSTLMDVDAVLEKAQKAKDAGATRFCMGAAWRHVKDGPEFDAVIEMVRGVRQKGMEACVTLGMLNANQAQRLADAGLSAYNHNIDTSPEYYDKIITTRKFQDRIETLDNVRKAGVSVCCGGIIGMGENIQDRASMLRVLSNMTPQPESVPINALVASKGTPLEKQKKIEPVEFIKTISVARIIMPRARIRLSAGRKDFSKETQMLAFYAGANSIFYGEKLLTTDNNDAAEDLSMIKEAGLKVSSTMNKEVCEVA